MIPKPHLSSLHASMYASQSFLKAFQSNWKRRILKEHIRDHLVCVEMLVMTRSLLSEDGNHEAQAATLSHEHPKRSHDTGGSHSSVSSSSCTSTSESQSEENIPATEVNPIYFPIFYTTKIVPEVKHRARRLLGIHPDRFSISYLSRVMRHSMMPIIPHGSN